MQIDADPQEDQQNAPDTNYIVENPTLVLVKIPYFHYQPQVNCLPTINVLKEWLVKQYTFACTVNILQFQVMKSQCKNIYLRRLFPTFLDLCTPEPFCHCMTTASLNHADESPKVQHNTTNYSMKITEFHHLNLNS